MRERQNDRPRYRLQKGCTLYGRKAEALSGVECPDARVCLQGAAVPFDTRFCR
ncbi:MAG TPA: hypothetical protein PLK12_03770 [Prolixibacteraceae bacterium]|nr:hypothetical protein [Prolixibacteraceae bacterium]